MGHGPEEVVGVEETDGVTSPYGRGSQGLGQELQVEDHIQHSEVQGNGGGPVEVLWLASLPESSLLQEAFR